MRIKNINELISFNHLPTEMRLEIFSYLPGSQVLQLRSVCRQWNWSILYDLTHLWGRVEAAFPEVCATLGKEELKQQSVPLFATFIDKLIPNLANKRELKERAPRFYQLARQRIKGNRYLLNLWQVAQVYLKIPQMETPLPVSVREWISIPSHKEKLETIKMLNLAGQKCGWVPKEVLYFKEITTLNLNLTQKPPGSLELNATIGQCIKLEALSCMGNNMHTVQEAISLLVNLKFLDLSHNKIEDLPEGMSKLQNLQTLDISFNNFAKIPDFLREMASLQEIIVTGNPIDPPWHGFEGIKIINKHVRVSPYLSW